MWRECSGLTRAHVARGFMIACATLILKAMKNTASRRRTTLAPNNKAWEAFVTWCQCRGLNPVPANPWAVAAYARSLEGRLKPATIRKRIGGLTRVHAEKTRKRLAHHPLVQRTLDIIERRAKADKSDGSLFADDDALATRPPKRPRRKSTAKPEPGTTPKPGRKSLSGQPRLVSRRTLKR